MEALITQGNLYKCLEAHLLGALAKWGPYLFIGTNGTLWNLGGFLTIHECSGMSYTILCTSLYTRDF